MHYGYATADSDLFKEALETYFHCQALGHLPNQTSQCDPKKYQQYIYPNLEIANYFFSGFITTANLMFLINWRKVTKFCTHYYYESKINKCYGP